MLFYSSHMYISHMLFIFRNMLLGSTSDNEYEVVAFPGLKELLAAPLRSDDIDTEISKHVTQIYIAMTVALDYSMRAIIDKEVFAPE